MVRKLSVARFNRFQQKVNDATDALFLTAYLEIKRVLIGAERLVKTPDGRWVDAIKHDSSVSVVGHYPPKSRSEGRRERVRAEAVYQRKLEEGSGLGPPAEVPIVDHLEVYRQGLSLDDKEKFGTFLDTLVEMKKNPPPPSTPPEESPVPLTLVSSSPVSPFIRRRPAQARRPFGLRRASLN